MKIIALLLTLAFFVVLNGAEIFVGAGQKYKTVNAGVKALKEGDTLTILPGRYYERGSIKMAILMSITIIKKLVPQRG